MARGNGTVTSSTYSGLNFTTSNPPRRDTVRQPPSELKSVQLTHALMNQIVIPRNSYAVLRFVTDDPGVWPLHCHIGWHLAGVSTTQPFQTRRELIELCSWQDGGSRCPA